MKSERKSLLILFFRRFLILVFILLICISVFWLFLTREIILKTAEVDSFPLLFEAGIFAMVVIAVMVILAVLLWAILIHPVIREWFVFSNQLSDLKNAPYGTRIKINENDEFGDAGARMNQVIQRFEKELESSVKMIGVAEAQFEGAQKLLGSEQSKIFEEKEKFNYVLSNISDGVILLSRNKNFAAVNKAAEEILGVNQNEVLNKKPSAVFKLYQNGTEILMDEYVPLIQPDTEGVYKKKRLDLESQHGTPKLVDMACLPLRLIKGQDLGYMIVLRDLSDEAEAEKRKASLVAAFAREIERPVGMIKKYFGAKAEGRGVGDTYGVAGALYLSLIEDNLNTAGLIEGGQINIVQEEVDLFKLAEELIGIIKPMADEKNILLENGELKDFQALVFADRTKTLQVLMNLLMNAINYSQTDGKVNMSFSESDGEIITRIQDAGIGLRSEDLKNVFTRLFVSENNKDVRQGLGLGLYICRRLVELQNGRIWIDSVEGRGTVVSFSLPKR
jgi:two-component system sensor histidine kinase VicK